jgi:hypothetical protein
MRNDGKREPGPRRPGWRRETAHKDSRNQFGFTIRSNKDLMLLSTAMDPSGMDELGKQN